MNNLQKMMDVYRASTEYKELSSKWYDMFKRCYSKKWLDKHPSYKDYSVCEDWFLFSNIKLWAEQFDYKGLHLDKDLLGDGKSYSPENCAFIPPEVNRFLTIRAKGVTTRPGCSGFFMQVCMGRGTKHISKVFPSAEQAALSYYEHKLIRAKELIVKYELECRLSEALIGWVNKQFKPSLTSTSLDVVDGYQCS